MNRTDDSKAVMKRKGKKGWAMLSTLVFIWLALTVCY